MMNFKLGMKSLLAAVLVLSASRALAYDETRCSGRGCLSVPAHQHLQHNVSYSQEESTKQNESSGDNLLHKGVYENPMDLNDRSERQFRDI